MMRKFNIDIKDQNEYMLRFCIKTGEQFLSFEEVFKLWEHDPEFVRFYTEELIKLNYRAFYWEHPALKKEFMKIRYECILQKSRPLEQLPLNENAFKDYIVAKEQVVDFMNLGKDARLVVPTKKTDKEIYNHLGRFLRLAEKEQVNEVFKRVGKTIFEELEKQKVIWLNTAGLGVIWLHIRLDTRPKYYKTTMYKDDQYLDKWQGNS